MSSKTKQAIQWIIAWSIPIFLLTFSTLLLYFVLNPAPEEPEIVEIVDVVIIERDIVDGYCAWFWCTDPEYHITFEFRNTGNRRTQQVPEWYFRTVQVGDIVPYNILNESLYFD